MTGISKSQVSRLFQELDAVVERFRSRRLEGRYPYVWLDATFVKVRVEGRVVSVAVVLATSVRATGEREVLGFDVGPSEDGAFWHRFLRPLLARGLAGVQLVISDAHQGLTGAIAAVLQGASWQRCRVHTIRTQWRKRCRGAGAGRLGRRAAERDDVLHLERVVADDDALHQELEDRLLVCERGVVQAAAHPRAECRQVGEHGLGAGALLAQLRLLGLLRFHRLPPHRELLAAIGQFV
jgi:hypothetical protein